jgi:hypothetical protein
MENTAKVLALAMACAMVCGGGCKDDPAPTEAQTVVWPPGDADRGRQAFVDLGCSTCHGVMNADLPAPTADPPVPLVLAGATSRDRTTAQLITAIVNPSHEIAPGMKDALVRSGSKSRMGDYGHVMTVRQLVDIVEFLGTVHGWSTYGDDAEAVKGNQP